MHVPVIRKLWIHVVTTAFRAHFGISGKALQKGAEEHLIVNSTRRIGNVKNQEIFPIKRPIRLPCSEGEPPIFVNMEAKPCQVPSSSMLGTEVWERERNFERTITNAYYITRPRKIPP